MAEVEEVKTTTRKPRAKKQSDSSAEATVQNVTPVAVEVQNVSPAPVVSVPEEKKTYRVKKDLDPNMYVVVKNGFNGTLVYRSNKTGEVFVWSSFGDEQELELQELKSAKNSYKSFFINNWFLFDDPEVIDWLGMTKYYKHSINAEGFDELFKKPVDEIEDILSKMPEGQKKAVAYRAKQLIADGSIDSMKVITTVEKALGVELIDR